jgi:hypothetical protein
MSNQNQSKNLFISHLKFNPSNDLTFNKPRVNKSGGKTIGIMNKKTNRLLNLSTPLMLTWGLNERVDEQSGRVSYDMALQFPSESYHNDQTKKFLETMIEFEDEVKKHAINNSKQWLNMSKLTDGQVDVLFHPMLNWPKNKETGEKDLERSPTLKVKLEYWDNEFSCEIYDMNKDLLFPNTETGVVPMDLLTKASHVACIIKCGGVWFANGKFGVTWRLVQAVVKPKASLTGRCFIELTSDEKEKLKGQQSEEEEKKEKTTTHVSDSDSDDNETNLIHSVVEETTEIPSVVEEKPKRKRIVRKKTTN